MTLSGKRQIITTENLEKMIMYCSANYECVNHNFTDKLFNLIIIMTCFSIHRTMEADELIIIIHNLRHDKNKLSNHNLLLFLSLCIVKLYINNN